MARADIPEPLRQFVHERARGRCEYCLTPETLSGIRCQIDHILPRFHQGVTTAENLCLACVACNGYKHARTHAIDPLSGKVEPLFNPRRQHWSAHFGWSTDSITIIGLTPIGRATIAILRMNDPLILAARTFWRGMGAYP